MSQNQQTHDQTELIRAEWGLKELRMIKQTGESHVVVYSRGAAIYKILSYDDSRSECYMSPDYLRYLPLPDRPE